MDARPSRWRADYLGCLGDNSFAINSVDLGERRSRRPPISFAAAIVIRPGQSGELAMRVWRALVLIITLGFASAASAQVFRIEDVTSATNTKAAQLAPETIAFSDKPTGDGADAALDLMHFKDWALAHPTDKKFLALYPSYVEPIVEKGNRAKPVLEKLYMYVAQARFVLDRAPGSIDLSHYVTPDFLSQIDPAIKHRLIDTAELKPLTDEAGMGNDNPDRKWCSGRQTSVCISSTYELEGKIPLGITLVNKLREGAKKISTHIDFQSEFSALKAADVDQSALQQLTSLDAPVEGVLEQNIFRVNQIMKFGKFFAVFQDDSSDPGKTVVTAFMAIAIKASILDEKRGFEKVPVLRNLVPADVLMGHSSFNSGNSISAGLPQYARNEIKTVAGILDKKEAAR
jgi:hypothetical protein